MEELRQANTAEGEAYRRVHGFLSRRGSIAIRVLRHRGKLRKSITDIPPIPLAILSSVQNGTRLFQKEGTYENYWKFHSFSL